MSAAGVPPPSKRERSAQRRLVIAGLLQLLGAAGFGWLSGAAEGSHLREIGVPEFLVALASAFFAVGLLRKQNWARRGSLWLLPVDLGLPALRLLMLVRRPEPGINWSGFGAFALLAVAAMGALTLFWLLWPVRFEES